MSDGQSLPPIRTPEANLQRLMRHVNGLLYPILQSHRGQRRGIIWWALQSHPGRCRKDGDRENLLSPVSHPRRRWLASERKWVVLSFISSHPFTHPISQFPPNHTGYSKCCSGGPSFIPGHCQATYKSSNSCAVLGVTDRQRYPRSTVTLEEHFG